MGRPQITYNNITLDFPEGAGAQNLVISKLDRNSRVRSASGIIETLSFYQDEIIKFDIPYYSRDFEDELKELYDYCRTGNSCKLVLDSDVGLYLPFEGKSSNTNDGGTATFTRTGAANVIDPYTNELESISENTERFPAGKFGGGLLIEGSCTNQCPNPTDWGTGWINTNITLSSNSTDVTDPGGTNIADKLTPNGGGTPLSYQDTTQAVGTTDACFSVWLRSLYSTFNVTLKLMYKNGAATELASETVSVTTEWQRFDVVWTSDGDYGADVYQIQITWADDTDQVLYAYYGQLETREYKTSNILTTRNAETIYYDISDVLKQTNRQWSISWWCKPFFDHDKHSEGVGHMLYLTRNGTSDRHSSFCLLANGNFEIRTYMADDTAKEIGVTAANRIEKDTWVYFCVTCDSAAADDFKFYVNGSLVSTLTTFEFSPTEASRLYIGSDSGGTSMFNGVFDDILIVKRVLSATEIENYYNLDMGWGIQKNTWDNVYFNNYEWNTTFINGAPRKTATLEFINKIT